MQNKPATLPSNLPVPSDPREYWDDSNPCRRWELTVNWKTKVYLTDQERNYFLAQIKAGKKIIRIGEMILTRHFDCLIPVRGKVRPVSSQELEAVVERERKRMKSTAEKGGSLWKSR
jgi:hypothetical protein